MELIKSDNVSFHITEIKTPSINNESLTYLYMPEDFYSLIDEQKYFNDLSKMLSLVNKKERYIISKFYLKSDKNKLCLLKDKSQRKYLNDAIYNNEIGIYSLLSFIRFYDFLPKVNTKYSLGVKENIFILDIKNVNNVLLQLRFLDNGNVDFLSLDKDPIADDDCKTYVIKGSFSTSEYLDKSYKIKRLLNILYE